MSRDIRHIRFLELDPRMKLLLVVVFASATFSAPNLLALIWMYLLVVVLYLARGLWLGAKKDCNAVCCVPANKPNSFFRTAKQIRCGRGYDSIHAGTSCSVFCHGSVDGQQATS